MYQKNSGGPATSKTVGTALLPGSSFITVVLSGLDKGTGYVVSVTAFNSRGAGRTYVYPVLETIVDRKMHDNLSISW